jgi:hypothetical protein
MTNTARLTYLAANKNNPTYQCEQKGNYCYVVNGTLISYDLCLKGYYCPTPYEQIKCKSDEFCGHGYVEPVKCAFPGIECKVDDKANNIIYLIIMAIITVSAVLLYWVVVVAIIKYKEMCFVKRAKMGEEEKEILLQQQDLERIQ